MLTIAFKHNTFHGNNTAIHEWCKLRGNSTRNMPNLRDVRSEEKREEAELQTWVPPIFFT